MTPHMQEPGTAMHHHRWGVSHILETPWCVTPLIDAQSLQPYRQPVPHMSAMDDAQRCAAPHAMIGISSAASTKRLFYLEPTAT
jgi:hypothetical protein